MDSRHSSNRPVKPSSILFFIHSIGGGGAERVAANLCNSWMSQNIKVTLVTIVSEDSPGYFVDEQVQRIGLGLDKHSRGLFDSVRGSVRRILAMRRILKRHNPEVVISFLPETNILTLLASVGMPGRRIVCERNFPAKQYTPAIWRTLRIYLYRHADCVVAQTHGTAHWLKQNCKLKDVVVIPNAAVWPLKSSLPEVHPQNVVDDEDKVVLMVAQLRTAKRIDRAIESFAHIAVQFPKWHLCIAGTGSNSQVSTLQNLIFSKGLESRIHLLGRVGNVENWYRRAELLLLTSHHEGFPNVIVEAMSCGCPVLSFDCDTGPGTIIRDQLDGELVEDGNIDAFTTQLSSLMNNNAKREKYAARCPEVLERFSEKTVLDLWSNTLAGMHK